MCVHYYWTWLKTKLVVTELFLAGVVLICGESRASFEISSWLEKLRASERISSERANLDWSGEK